MVSVDLTTAEIVEILDALSKKYGPGYADGDVGKLQAKLSIWAEVSSKKDDRGSFHNALRATS